MGNKVIKSIVTDMAGCLLALCLAAQSVHAQSATQPTTNAEQSYRINAGDQLEVYVWGDERLQRAVKVLPDGTIAFPLAGQLTAKRLLPSELERLISDRLKPQYRGEVPQVTVSVVAPLGLQFSVMGKVKSPGSFNPVRYVNVLEALSMAGGPADFANLDNIVVIRKTADGLSTLKVKAAALFKSGVGSREVADANIPTIQSGDTVIVP